MWHVARHVACDKRPGHLSVHVGDGSLHSEEIVKKSQTAPLNAIIITIIIIIWREFPNLLHGWLYPTVAPDTQD